MRAKSDFYGSLDRRAWRGPEDTRARLEAEKFRPIHRNSHRVDSHIHREHRLVGHDDALFLEELLLVVDDTRSVVGNRDSVVEDIDGFSRIPAWYVRNTD